MPGEIRTYKEDIVNQKNNKVYQPTQGKPGTVRVVCPNCKKPGNSYLGNGWFDTWCRGCRILYRSGNEVHPCHTCLRANECDDVLKPIAA